MKRMLILVISLLLMPILVNAETLTYDVCETCEYNNFYSFANEVGNLDNPSEKDIIINLGLNSAHNLNIGSSDAPVKSVVINGDNNEIYNGNWGIYAEKITINNLNLTSRMMIALQTKKIIVNNSNIGASFIFFDMNYHGDLKDVLSIDEYSLSKNKIVVGFNSGDSIVEIRDMDFADAVVLFNGTYNLYNCTINILSSGFIFSAYPTSVNIYNSKFNKIKYKQFTSADELFSSNSNNSTQDYNLGFYNIHDDANNLQIVSDLKIYFDKKAEIKLNDKINLVDYLDYYTEDKEISYTIEDESIAKIENKELIGLKPGNTKVQITTDEGHVIYNIDLTVYTISEKNVTMKAQNKLKLNSVFKDLDITSLSDDVWEISNPKVAKIVNGEIVSLSKGETDIVAIIDGVKYVYHLTVSDTLVSKEIKVPITGKSIKLWIVIVSILLFSVIGVCTYMLLKSKKAE